MKLAGLFQLHFHHNLRQTATTLSFAVASLLLCAATTLGTDMRAIPSDLEQRAVGDLRQLFKTQGRFVNVHAAESLLMFGYPDGVYETFKKEWNQHQNDPGYRAVVMRVLSRASETAAERKQWADRIRRILVDSAQPDRLHASECLWKLGYRVEEADKAPFEEAAQSSDPGTAIFTLGTLGAADFQSRESSIVEYLKSPDPVGRYSAAYVLRQSPGISQNARMAVKAAAQAEKPGTLAYAYLNSASLVLATPDDSPEAARCREVLTKLATTGNRDEVREICAAFGDCGDQRDVPLLDGLMNNSDPDIREAAAHALIRISRREQHTIGLADWVVIAGYAIGMLSVGWYCSRFIKTADDFLLGGRHLNPWAVALSLFAGLISTLSYLAMPGEMIKHGPMIASEMLAYPLIAVIIGYFFIPRFMKLKVTTAYELLETRLGVQARLLAASLFLTMRFFWMGLILFATSKLVLVPIFNWSEGTIPLVCAALAVVTLIYSSMGGFRAVVISDSIQTTIMFTGALVSILIISLQLGGFGAWWPHEWASTWDTPKFWFDPSLRVTVASACLAALTWHVCTAGSDQMAVQRYLAVRDVKAARKMFSLSLVVNGGAMALLAVLGIAVFAYFRARPDLLGDGQTIVANADELFPRFIVVGLPSGMSGLVIAALLAAAMGSLSSGISSTCSVVLVDFVDRIQGPSRTDSRQVRLARYISWTIGAVIFILSYIMTMVPGNLYEVTSKVVNLLVAPLFVLFFMALFIPRASTWGTIIATLCSIAVGASIAFFEVFGLSFLWIMPSSLVIGIALAICFSLPSILSGRDDRSLAVDPVTTNS
jgi:SSS family solute:Na+ symporter